LTEFLIQKLPDLTFLHLSDGFIQILDQVFRIFDAHAQSDQ
jgi:hypothetical protein